MTATTGERLVVGKVALQLAPGWLARPSDGERRELALAGPDGKQVGAVSAQAIGSLPRGGPSLEERLRQSAETFGKSMGCTQPGPAQRAVLGTVPALVAPMTGGLAAGLLVDGEVVLLFALWASEPAFKAINALLATARPVLPPAPVPPLGAARGAGLVGAELPFPTAWEVGPECGAPNRGAFWIPRALLGSPQPARYGAVLEVQPEPGFALREAAMRFVRVACAALGHDLEPDPKKIRVVGSSELALPDGSIVATVIVDEVESGVVQTRCVAHARGTAKALYLGAVATGPWSKGWPSTPDAAVSPDRVLEKVDDAAEALLAVLAQMRATPLPPVDAAATARLVAKGTWRRATEWSDAYSSPSLVGPGTFTAFAKGRSSEAWTFAQDGTCEVEASSSSTVSTYDAFSLQDGTPFQYSPALGLWREPEGKRTGRFEVRAGAPLVLVRREPGRVSMHTLDLDARGTYGKRETHGIAIDGQIEGVYVSSTGSAGTLETWRP